jgi:hypothetical protein
VIIHLETVLSYAYALYTRLSSQHCSKEAKSFVSQNNRGWPWGPRKPISCVWLKIQEFVKRRQRHIDPCFDSFTHWCPGFFFLCGRCQCGLCCLGASHHWCAATVAGCATLVTELPELVFFSYVEYEAAGWCGSGLQHLRTAAADHRLACLYLALALVC